MGTFAQTTIADYRLSFVDQGKTNFRFQQTNGSLPFQFSVGNKLTEIAISAFRWQKLTDIAIFR
jgi:hypothetical protein